ncbi:MAG TPA: DoxX family protein [Saprospiraceae bacterium]|nr:DoxX family protein [Saprospiraceae bacterium]
MTHFLFGNLAPDTNIVQDIALLGMRLILAYVFYHTAMEKWSDMDATINWFGNKEWGLGMPFPALNAYMAATTELVGAILLVIGLGSRTISLPLIFVMIIALVTVHMGNGWLAIGDSMHDPEIADRLSKAKDILKAHGDYAWLTAKGGFVILQNGVEFVIMYMVMLLAIVGTGPGRFSLDRLLHRVKTGAPK